MNNLKQAYEQAVNNYLMAFCHKHEFDYTDAKNSWVGNDVGGIVCVADYYVNLDTIRTDIDRDAPVDEFVKWYDYTLRIGMIDINAPMPNYDSWLMGCPRLSDEQISKWEELHRKTEESKEELLHSLAELSDKNLESQF